MAQADTVLYGPLRDNFSRSHPIERHARERNLLPRWFYPSEHAMVRPTTGPARDDFVPLYHEVFQGKTEIGERTAPRAHCMSDAVRPMDLMAAVCCRVVGMVDIGRSNHLLDGLELPLVPYGGDRTPYHRFVCLWLSREAALHGAQAIPQETSFQP